MTKYWLFSGPQENWEKAISHGTWGAEPGSQPAKQCWSKIRPGDIALFYATHPVKGLIGLGILKAKTKSTIQIWNTTHKLKHDYECRAPFETIFHVLDSSKEPINISDLSIQKISGMNSLVDKTEIKEIFYRLRKQWRIGKPSLLARKTVILRSTRKYKQIRNWTVFIIGTLFGFLFEKGLDLFLKLVTHFNGNPPNS